MPLDNITSLWPNSVQTKGNHPWIAYKQNKMRQGGKTPGASSFPKCYPGALHGILLLLKIQKRGVYHRTQINGQRPLGEARTSLSHRKKTKCSPLSAVETISGLGGLGNNFTVGSCVVGNKWKNSNHWTYWRHDLPLRKKKCFIWAQMKL